MKYYREYDAVQFKEGGYIKEIEEFTKDYYDVVFSNTMGTALISKKSRYVTILTDTDWLIKLPVGGIEIWKDESFKRRFFTLEQINGKS